MKKIIFLIFMLIASIGAIAQELTVELNRGESLDLTTTTWYGTNLAGANRLIPTTRDTIDYIIVVKNQGANPLNFTAILVLDTIAGVDTTVAITVSQKMFAASTYADLIPSALTAVVNGELVITKTTLGVTVQQTNTTASAVDLLRQTIIANNDTLTVASRVQTEQVNALLYYRYLRFRLILKGNDSVGTGVKIKRFEIQYFN